MTKNKIILIILFLLSVTNSFAAPKIKVKSAILMDFHSDKILYEVEPDIHIYPASMTKIMTTLIAFEYLKSKLSLFFFKMFIKIKMFQ